jgi:hypothetical protein
MDDTTWAIRMSDEDTAPDYFLDALRNARELGEEDFANEVVGTAASMLIDSKGADPLVNCLMLGSQAFGRNMIIQMSNGPVHITFEVRDAPTE